jgi:hypothetical protein
MIDRYRVAMTASLVASAALLSGCVSAPTYGTDKTQSSQLVEDVTSMFSFKPPKREAIDYKPRPELVEPAQKASLPAPQQSIVGVDNPAWPESPEQQRARIRAEATANQNNLNYEPSVINDVSVAEGEQRDVIKEQEEFNPPSAREGRKAQAEVARRLAESKQGDPTKRKFLSEPPLEYREAAATAPAGELGEDEAKKERDAKRAARKSKGFVLRDLVPWL